MKTRISAILTLSAVIAIGLSACASNQPANQTGLASSQAAPAAATPAAAPVPENRPPRTPAMGAIGAETVITVHGKIVSVDRKKKLVTLEGPGKKTVTLAVDNPYNLESMKAGNRFVAQFREAITIVGKGPSDKPPVATLAGGLWTAKPGSVPGALAAQVAKLTVEVAAVDPADGRVTLRAPDSSTETVDVTEPHSLNGLHVGDRIVITLTRSIAIRLVPERT